MAVTRKSKASSVQVDLWRVPPRLQAKLASPTVGCSIALCGTVADDQTEPDPGLVGMVRVGVYGSAEPDRIWCGGLCATFGIALAELRVRPAATTPEPQTPRSTAPRARKGTQHADHS